eukprot:UN26603
MQGKPLAGSYNASNGYSTTKFSFGSITEGKFTHYIPHSVTRIHGSLLVSKYGTQCQICRQILSFYMVNFITSCSQIVYTIQFYHFQPHMIKIKILVIFWNIKSINFCRISFFQIIFNTYIR